METQLHLTQLLSKHNESLVGEWVKQQLSSSGSRLDLIKESELRTQCTALLSSLQDALHHGDGKSIATPAWSKTRELLNEISRTRARQGFSPSETATFVFSLKQPLFALLNDTMSQDPKALFAELWSVTSLLDKLGLYTVETFQKTREEIITRQTGEMLELSTPVIKLWDGILALPLVGTLDSRRAQMVMETLLQRIVETGADVAIIDITGVPTVDTLVAQHLLKTVAAAKLMGADCIISGIRPQIAQTMVHLAIDLGQIITKSNLSDAFAVALRQRRLVVAPAQAQLKSN